ncbi:IS4 family transposase [Pseudovibrio ascidiaceicola]|uniref:IS4 family transposase n=1 Tax=Pseudovibrio ascidiaceicola TaxID=285279 RepID=UPI003D368DFD
MTNSPPVASKWEDLLSSLPAHLDLDQSAIKHRALMRRREISSGKDLLRLAFAYGPCGMSLRSTAAWASVNGLGKLSDVAVLKRLKGAKTWLEHIVSALLPDAEGQVFPNGHRLRLVDGTCISKPGSKGTDFRVHASYDPATGRFTHLKVTDVKVAEDLTHGPVEPGDIHIADRGYARARGLHHILKEGGDFLVRTGWSKVGLNNLDGSRFDLFAALSQVNCGAPLEHSIIIGGRIKAHHIPARLIILRKPPEAAEQEKKRLRRNASKKGTKLKASSLIAAEYMLLLTSLPQEYFNAASLAALYRLRWQIELAFKRLKSILHMDRLPAKDPDLAKTWLLAHLILALLIERSSKDLQAIVPYPEEKTGRIPSTWRLYKMLSQALILAIQGVWNLNSITTHGRTFWRAIYEPPRKRKPQQIPRHPLLS